MGRHHIKLAAVMGVLLWGCAFTASAQSGIVVADNGLLNLEATTTANSGDTYFIKIGTGWTSTTTTGMFVTISGYYASQINNFRADLLGFPDNTYNTVGFFSDCSFSGVVPVGTSSQATYDLNSVNNFGSSTACVMQPDRYYVIDLQGNVSAGFGGNSGTTFWGGATSAHGYTCETYTINSGTQCDLPAPYFVLSANGFHFTPTTGSSGIFFSGALDYCNAAFASSSGIGASIGNGLCVASGFLFIPNSDSVNQMQSVPGLLEGTPPLSWIRDIASIYEDAQASSTSNFINVGIDFGPTTTKAVGIVGKYDVISTTTISRYMPENIRQAILFLEGAVFLASAAGTIYWTVKNIWKTT